MTLSDDAEGAGSPTASELGRLASLSQSEGPRAAENGAPDVALDIRQEPEPAEEEDQEEEDHTPRTTKKLKKQNKRMKMAAIIAGSFINDEVGDTSSEEEEEEEEEEEIGWEILILPLTHFCWYVTIAVVAVTFLSLWLKVIQGGAGVRERIEHLVEDVVFVHQDVQGEIFSPEGFVRWVSERLLPALSPPPEECYPGICSTLGSHSNSSAVLAQYGMPQAPNVAVWLEDDFNIKDTTLWSFGNVATEFCASFLLAAPSGALLQEISARSSFTLPASGAQGVAIEGGLASDLFNHVAGLSVCDATDSSKCINITLGSKLGPGSIAKRLTWCADGPAGKCTGSDKSKEQLASFSGQANLRGSMASPLQPESVGTHSGNQSCIQAKRNPSAFGLLLTPSRAVFSDDQCSELAIHDDARIGNMLRGGFRVRLLVSGVVAGAGFVKLNYVRVRQATQDEVNAGEISIRRDAHSDKDGEGSDLSAKFPVGSTRLAPFYLSEHDVLLRQVRGVAHVKSSELEHSAIFDARLENKESYGTKGQYVWHSSQGPGPASISGFWGDLTYRSFPLWYPDSGFSQVVERSRLLRTGSGKDLTDDLLRNGWVDRRTRAIFVEFSLTSFDTRQAFPHLVRVVAEFSPYGHVELDVDVQSKSVDLLLNGVEYGEPAVRAIWVSVLVSLAMLVLHAIVVLVSETMELTMLGFEYVENLWNVIDVASIVLLLWSLVDFSVFANILLGFLATVQGKDSSVPTTECKVPGARSCELFASHQLTTTLEKFILAFSFFSSLHVFKFLKYATLVPALDIPFQAMLKVAGRVAALTFTVMVCLVAFAIMFTGFAGPHMDQFSEVHLSLLQMLSMMTNFDTDAMLELVETRPVTGSLLRSLASFLIVIIMLTVFIAVLVEGYTLAVEADEEHGDIHHMYYNLIRDKIGTLRSSILQRFFRTKVTPTVANSKLNAAIGGKVFKKGQPTTERSSSPLQTAADNGEDDILKLASAILLEDEGAPTRAKGNLLRRKHTRVMDGAESSPTHAHAPNHRMGHHTSQKQNTHGAKIPHRPLLREGQSPSKLNGKKSPQVDIKTPGEVGTQVSKTIVARVPNMWGKAAVAAALARKASQAKSLQSDSAAPKPSRTSHAAKALALEEKVSDLQVISV